VSLHAWGCLYVAYVGKTDKGEEKEKKTTGNVCIRGNCVGIMFAKQ